MSLRLKFILWVALGLGLVNATIGTYEYQSELANSHKEAKDRAQSMVELLAKISAGPLSQFDIPMLEDYRSEALKNQDVSEVAIIDSENTAIAGKPLTEQPDHILVRKEITTADGAIGTVMLSYSLDRIQRHLADMRVNLLAKSVASFLVVSLLLFTLFSTLVNRRLGIALANTVQLGEGDFDVSTPDRSKDELGKLGSGLNKMASQLRGMMVRLEEANSSLESKVEERTAQIATIVDNVQAGFLLMDQNCKILPGFTKSCAMLFGQEVAEDQHIGDILELDQRSKEHFEVAISQVFDDIMPEEVNFSIIPDRFKVKDRTLELLGRCVRNKDDSIDSILYTINDISLLESAERQNRLNRTLISILNQKNEFIQFIADAKDALQNIKLETESDQKSARIALHTIKGNAGAFELNELAQTVHDVEGEARITSSHIHRVEESVKGFLLEFRSILKIAYTNKDEASPQVILDMKTLEELNLVMSQGRSAEDIRADVFKWIYRIKLRPAEELLAPLVKISETVAERLFKDVAVTVEGGTLLVDPDQLAPLIKVLPHVMRNCIDHGIESPDARHGKPSQGQIVIAVEDLGFLRWCLTIHDDGRGIDANRVAAKAVELGIRDQDQIDKMTEQDVLGLIFESSLSTAEQVTDVSGRGVGMAAVLETVTDLGGTITIDSKLGKGTKFVFVIPKKNRGESSLAMTAA